MERNYIKDYSDTDIIGQIGFSNKVTLDLSKKKNVLITGANSYIGTFFKNYAYANYKELFAIDEIDMIDGAWKNVDFSKYDLVYHVAGIAHADVGNVSDEVKEKYYKVNTDLAIETAIKAKAEGVKQFIYMSSMIVYGDSASYGKMKLVTKNTVPEAANFYGDSKLQADVTIRMLADDNFRVVVLRPPMIYGPNSKGNYPLLAKIAKKIPCFPEAKNERSMLYIENLCEFLCQIMSIENSQDKAVVLVPQNGEWTKTSEMVSLIANENGKNIKIWKWLNIFVKLASIVPGKIGGLANKAFGNNCYSHDMSIYEGLNYQKYSLIESVRRTEKKS